jgi:oligopeptide transport system ATP-binding protein
MSGAAGSMAIVGDPREDLLVLDDVHTHFDLGRNFLSRESKGVVKAVDGVSLAVKEGEILGLVGESGCGKSTLSRTIIQLIRPTSGRVWFKGHELTAMNDAEVRRERIDFQMIFQDPYASLNPRMTVLDTLAEAVRTRHPDLKGDALRSRVAELLRTVGLNPAHMKRYPHEFSGGQRQRVAIARALAPEPKLIIADEPVSALDVSIQSQILNLLKRLVRELGLTMIFISHDLSVVRYISDRIAVMYLGRIIELGSAEDIIDHPLHLYTKALMSAIPEPDPRAERARERIVLSGDPPSPLDPPSGCNFWPRSPVLHDDRMKQVEPPFEEVLPNHWVAACPFCVSERVKAVEPA